MSDPARAQLSALQPGTFAPASRYRALENLAKLRRDGHLLGGRAAVQTNPPDQEAITKGHRPAASASYRGWDGFPLRLRPMRSPQACPFGPTAGDGVSCWQEPSRLVLRSGPPSLRIGCCALKTGPCRPCRVLLQSPVTPAASSKMPKRNLLLRPLLTTYRCRNSPS